MEDENERIKEVEAFEDFVRGRNFLQDVNGDPYPDLFPRSIYSGTYNYFDIESFLSFLRERVVWKYPEYNSLIVQVEGEHGLRFYNLSTGVNQ